MATAAELPSLIDDANFMAELDKLERDPGQPEADALSVYWEQAARVDEPGEGRLSAGALAPPGPAIELPVRPTRSGKSVRPVRVEKRLKLETPGRIEVPSRPEGPARSETSTQPKRPVRPAHADEIGRSARKRATVVTAGSTSQARLVPTSLALLTVALCFCAGAGSAALVFHDRVGQIAVTWKK